MDTRPIRFFHRGRIVELAGARPTRSVLDWLREDQRATGTKEGCAEGDCGACTVVLGELDEAGALRLRSANACIQLLPMLDGKALFTVEDLAPVPGPLHPVQQALVDHHGSQCGFCTPGFVMSLWACRERHLAAGTTPTREQLADELAGNLCRCTGYRPILDAAQSLFAPGATRVRVDPAPVEEALRTLAADAALADDGRVQVPRTLDELATLRAERPQARLVAGATDVGLWINKQLRELPELILTGRVDALRRIEVHDGALHVGAAVPLEDAWKALVDRWPALHDLWIRFASPPVRHAGTLGGNLANGSPIGDSAPVLMALDARLVLQRREFTRELPLSDFYTGYQRNRLEPGEFLRQIVVPLPRPGIAVRAYKNSKRFASDISALCAAYAIGLDDAGRVHHARLAYGGMAATVRRAAAAEASLLGRAWDEAALAAATQALAQDFQPIDDLRASAGYRQQMAAALLRRCWLETRAAGALPAQALSVWARGEPA
ncbi:MAG: xanthine dehydrogenase small subunit [Rubrivivax sp.]